MSCAPETAANFAHFAEQPESTTHPERSAAFTLGMVQNIAIVTTAWRDYRRHHRGG